jgi:hypothetical protein
MLIIHLRLTQSALGQKAEAKPLGLPQRERSQGRPAMGGREVAGLPSELMELPLGWNLGRVTSFLAKSGLSASIVTGRVTAQAASGAPRSPVQQAITSRIRKVRFTDEVPRRPVHGQVSPGYKSYTKGQGYASAAGTAFPRPRPKGGQQRQSRGLRPSRFPGPGACSERQNLRVPLGPLRFMGPVSPAIAATTWPGGTSSPQPAGSPSNSPQQPKPGPVAVRPR